MPPPKNRVGLLVTCLVARGANLDARDTLWNGTPLGWAVHTGKRNAEAWLRALIASRTAST